MNIEIYIFICCNDTSRWMSSSCCRCPWSTCVRDSVSLSILHRFPRRRRPLTHLLIRLTCVCVSAEDKDKSYKDWCISIRLRMSEYSWLLVNILHQPRVVIDENTGSDGYRWLFFNWKVIDTINRLLYWLSVQYSIKLKNWLSLL